MKTVKKLRVHCCMHRTQCRGSLQLAASATQGAAAATVYPLSHLGSRSAVSQPGSRSHSRSPITNHLLQLQLQLQLIWHRSFYWTAREPCVRYELQLSGEMKAWHGREKSTEHGCSGCAPEGRYKYNYNFTGISLIMFWFWFLNKSTKHSCPVWAPESPDRARVDIH